MKKFILFSISAVMMLAVSCQKTSITNNQAQGGEGYLSFTSLVLDIDEAVDTKAASSLAPAQNYYQITIEDADGNVCLTKTYKEIKDADNKVTLPAGNYVLKVSSTDEAVPDVEWEYPVYGATKEFSITAGELTEIGEITCTLTQCKVSVDYSPEFLSCVTGPGKTTVTIKTGCPLEYTLISANDYEKRNGFFLVEGTSMTVVFQGSIDGKNKKMTKVFNNIAPKQWRQIKFIQKVNEQGDATFDIVINPLVSDAELNNELLASGETILGEDPEAPKGDGGISLNIDYEGGCDPEITDLENILIVPMSERKMAIRFRALVPNGVKKFNVTIDSDNAGFLAAVDAAKARELDLISPLPDNDIIFEVVPFPHGEEELLGKTDIPFNLDAAQDAILNFSGHHTFLMNIVDNQGCRKQIPVVMVVE